MGWDNAAEQGVVRPGTLSGQAHVNATFLSVRLRRMTVGERSSTSPFTLVVET